MYFKLNHASANSSTYKLSKALRPSFIFVLKLYDIDTAQRYILNQRNTFDKMGNRDDTERAAISRHLNTHGKGLFTAMCKNTRRIFRQKNTSFVYSNLYFYNDWLYEIQSAQYLSVSAKVGRLNAEKYA